MRRLVRRSAATVTLFSRALARLGAVDRDRGLRAFDLALPVMVTGEM
jgi:hypothetical protein